MTSAIETVERPDPTARRVNRRDYEKAVHQVVVSRHGGRHLDGVCAGIAGGVAQAIATVP